MQGRHTYEQAVLELKTENSLLKKELKELYKAGEFNPFVYGKLKTFLGVPIEKVFDIILNYNMKNDANDPR